MGKVKIGPYFYLTTDILTKVLQKCSLSRLNWHGHILKIAILVPLQKWHFLLTLLVCFRCYGNLKFPLAYNGKSENCPLLLSHCRYFDKSFTEMFLE